MRFEDTSVCGLKLLVWAATFVAITVLGKQCKKSVVLQRISSTSATNLYECMYISGVAEELYVCMYISGFAEELYVCMYISGVEEEVEHFCHEPRYIFVFVYMCIRMYE